MNQAFANTTKRALTASGFETRGGFCCRFIRQDVMCCYGLKSVPPVFKEDANETAAAFKAGATMDVPHLGGTLVFSGEDYHEQELEPGDIVFKIFAPHGHVGAAIDSDEIGENSTAHVTPEHPDARGIRSVAAWKGAHGIDVVGRIEFVKDEVAAPKPTPLPVALAPAQPDSYNEFIYATVTVDGKGNTPAFKHQGRLYPQLDGLLQSHGSAIVSRLETTPGHWDIGTAETPAVVAEVPGSVV